VNVIWASSHIADPALGGGWAYEYELLAHAAERHQVVVVSGELHSSDPLPAPLADLGVEVVPAAVPSRELPRSRARLLRVLATSSAPLGAWMFEPVRSSLLAAVRSLESARAVDLVHVMPQEAAPIAAATSGPSAIVLGDSYTVQAERELSAATSAKDRLRLRLECRNARRWERAWYPRASALGCASPADARVLSSLCQVPVDVVPVAVGDEWFVPSTVARVDDLVVLVGALDYWPNVDAVTWFCDQIWPSVRRRRPSARLRVIGRRPTAAVRSSVAGAGAELLADVPDVRPHYWEASVAVAPVRLGSGVKNKVLHAAACGAPQVGTTFAFDGVDAVSGTDVLMADTAESLADAVLATLADRGSAAARARCAERIADAHRRVRAGLALDALWNRACAVRRVTE
jgi:hypothetical protein